MVDKKIITLVDRKSPEAEAYRILRTNIAHTDIPGNMQVLLVTSSRPSEGKTVTAVNLAITEAEIGKKVLLIDADIRRPSLHRKLGIDKSVGLSEVLQGSLNWRDAIKSMDVPNLHVITSGEIPTNPSELIGSRQMERFLEEIKKDYDRIIFDSPSVLVVTDAAILSCIVDGVLLVVMAEVTPREAIQRSIAQLVNIKSRILGVVLNNVYLSRSRAYYYYRY